MKIKKVEERPMVIHVRRFQARKARGDERLRDDGAPGKDERMKKVLLFVQRQGDAAMQAGEKSSDAVLDNVEGGEEIREAAGVVRDATQPAGRMAWGYVLGKAERARKRKRLKVREGRRETVRAKKDDSLKARREKVKIRDEGENFGKAEKRQPNRERNRERGYGEDARGHGGKGRGAEGNAREGGKRTKGGAEKAGSRSRSTDERGTGGEARKAQVRKRKIEGYLKERGKSEAGIGRTVKKLPEGVRDAVKAKLAKIAPVVLAGFLCVILLIAAAAAPIAGVVYVIYHSPLAIFLPPLESGDTVASVTARYFADYVRERQAEADNHTGFDLGKLSYWRDAEDYRSVMAVYVVRYGIGDVATVMNDRAKRNLKQVFDDSYTYSVISTSTEVTTPVYGADGTVTYVTETKSVKEVLIAKTDWTVLGERYGFTPGQMQLLSQIMGDADSLPGG